MHCKKMLYVWSILWITIINTSPLRSAFEYPGPGWPSATGNIRSIGGMHPARLLVNPALIRTDGNSHFSIQYHKPFIGLDLNAGSVAALSYLRGQPVVSGIEYFGDDIYREWKITAGSSWRVEDQFRIGTSFSYHQLDLAQLDPRRSLTVSASLFIALSDNFQIGSVLANLIQVNKDLKVPQNFQWGVQYLSEPVILLAGVEKEAALPLEICLGMLYSPRIGLEIGMGYRDFSGSMSAGWRLLFQSYALSYNCVMHPELPVSHGLGVELILP